LEALARSQGGATNLGASDDERTQHEEYIRKVREDLMQQDKEDKATYKERIKKKHLKQRIRDKELNVESRVRFTMFMQSFASDLISNIDSKMIVSCNLCGPVLNDWFGSDCHFLQGGHVDVGGAVLGGADDDGEDEYSQNDQDGYNDTDDNLSDMSDDDEEQYRRHGGRSRTHYTDGGDSGDIAGYDGHNGSDSEEEEKQAPKAKRSKQGPSMEDLALQILNKRSKLGS
jgi:hypothetical protein